MTSAYVTKGTRISFRFFGTKPVALAGAQMKFEGSPVEGVGTVRNVWADDPEGKVNLRFNVELDDGTFIEVPSGGVTGVLAGEQ